MTGDYQQERAVLSMVEKALFLKAVPSFAQMSTEQLRILAAASHELHFPPDAVIVETNDPGDQLFVIVSGRVSVEERRGQRASIVRIATLGPREPFGELAVFDELPHTTRAVAIDACHLLAVQRDVLHDLIRRYPELAFEIIRLLSRRLREATSTIVEKSKPLPRQLLDLYDNLSE